jgi:beta-glucosidase
MDFKTRHNDAAPHTYMDWEVYPEGLYKLLKRFHEEYHIPKLYVTENGSAYNDVVEEIGGETVVRDSERLDYLRQHFEAALKAIQEGVPLAGYFVWSLFDNFEWGYGYDKRFGLVYVDYPTQKRIVKDSGRWYQKLLKS